MPYQAPSTNVSKLQALMTDACQEHVDWSKALGMNIHATFVKTNIKPVLSCQTMDSKLTFCGCLNTSQSLSLVILSK